MLGWRCLWCAAWFSTLCRVLPLGPAVCAGCPWGFSAFSVTGCLTYCCSGGVGLAATLPLFICASPAPAGLQGFAGFCTVSGSSHWGCVCSLGDSVISLLAFPYLRWVRFWPALSTASVSCEVCSLGCPSWLVLLFMSLFVLHLLLSWGGLVTGLWPHLQLVCVGLFGGLCCAVLSP